MKKILFILAGIVTFIISFAFVWIVYFNVNLRSTTKKSEPISFAVEEGNTYYTIADELYDSKLIRSEFVYKMYVKFTKPKHIKAGVYQLDKNMNVRQIIEALSGNIKHDLNNISITFKEGRNMKYIIKQIVDNTDNKEEDVLNLLKDEEYLNELIDDYWFIDEEILNDNLYYSLEGYLYPNTYNFKKDVKVEEIFNVMIDQTAKKLSKYKKDIKEMKYTPHQILTLASIVELEGSSGTDRKGIAGVFYNRLNNNWSLGSDVTTYYGAGVELSERDLTTNEINSPNAYNTRSATMIGKLPVGPICNPSEESIEAVIHPTEHDYFYFVSDKNDKTYFTKTDSEHIAKINELVKAGLWYTYN